MLHRILITLLLLFTLAAAQDSYNNKTTANETPGTVEYRIAFDFTSSPEGNKYSKAIRIGDANAVDGRVLVKVTDASGTEDIDFILQYSIDGETWTNAAADDELTQVTTGTVVDTLGIVDGVDDGFLFHGFNLLRVLADGQTGNPAQSSATEDVVMFIALTKDEAYHGDVAKAVNNSK